MELSTRSRFCVLIVLLAGVPSAARAGQTVWLDELNMRYSTCGWQSTQRKRAVGGQPLRLRGKHYERGIGTHAPGQISVELAGGAKRFTAVIGIDDESNGGGSSEFIIRADGKQVFNSGVVRGRDAARLVDLDVTGVKQLDLIVTVAGDGYGFDHTDWCDAKFEVVGLRPKAVKPPPPPRPTEFDVIQRQIAKGKGYWQRMAPETFHPAALIHESDRDPADVVLRRTRALLEHIREMDGAPDLSAQQAQLDALRAEAAKIDVKDTAARRKLFGRAAALRRKIAFANPLLDFDKILFIKKHFLPGQERLGNHMCDQYFGFHAIREGGLFVLEDPFSDKPIARDVLAGAVCENGRFKGRKLDDGGFLSPDLSFDGGKVLFAYTEAEPTRYRWSERSTYHIFGVNVDGTGLRQLTDGAVNDFDPTWTPAGRVVFISERRGGFGRCHGRPVPSYTLHDMLPDGSDIRCLSPHETNEWHPSINNDGMIVYTRWDYVDRGFNQAHHPWITSPDGRDSRALHGNFARTHGGRPQMEMDCRAIPDSRKYVATACGHHGQAYGSLIVIDPSIEQDNFMATTRRLTPEGRFPESEGGRRRYATAWPLSEHFYLCVYDPDGAASRGTANRFAICLLDAFGNKEEIYRDADISCLSPIPLRPRPVPPVISAEAEPERPPRWISPARINKPDGPATDGQAGRSGPARREQTAPVAVMDVYDTEDTWPEGTRIAALRIVELLPKTTPHANGPRIGYGDQKGARAVLGTVPVEADGSAHFLLPAGVPVYFQALDANGMAVQSMRSATYVHPGQRLICQGCHELRSRSPRQREAMRPLALRRGPSTIRPEPDGSNPFSFPRLVQPVLDRNCVPCHEKNRAKRAPDLSAGDVGRNNGQWYPSYRSLQGFAFYFNNAVWTAPRTVPGKVGARVSKLYGMLTTGTHASRVKLSAEDLHRITLWLDCNSDFYGSYEHLKDQAHGEVVAPALE